MWSLRVFRCAQLDGALLGLTLRAHVCSRWRRTMHFLPSSSFPLLFPSPSLMKLSANHIKSCILIREARVAAFTIRWIAASPISSPRSTRVRSTFPGIFSSLSEILLSFCLSQSHCHILGQSTFVRNTATATAPAALPLRPRFPPSTALSLCLLIFLLHSRRTFVYHDSTLPQFEVKNHPIIVIETFGQIVTNDDDIYRDAYFISFRAPVRSRPLLIL